MPRRTLPGDPKAKMQSARKAMALTALETKAQQFTNPKFLALVLLVLLVALNGCVSLTVPPAERLREHPKRVVRYPANAGQAVGTVVGIPLSIVLLPVTVPYIYLATDRSFETGQFAMVPWVVSQAVGIICVGGPPWLLFGWWGRTEPVEKPRPGSAEDEIAITESFYYLGNCYLNGQGRTKKDEMEAYIYFLVAASRGHEDASKMLSTLESRLTQAQIAEGKQRAQVWVEHHQNRLQYLRSSPPPSEPGDRPAQR